MPKLDVPSPRASTPSPVLPPSIPGLTITPLAPTPQPAFQTSVSSSPDLQKLLKTLGTNIIPITEKSKSPTSGLTIQPISAPAVAPQPPAPVALPPTPPKATLPAVPVSASTPKVQQGPDANMFFKKLPSPMEINNAQLKQPNGAGFFKLPPGTTKYIAENKQRRLAPPTTLPAAAAPPPPLPPQLSAKGSSLPGVANAGNFDTALAMAAMLQSAILHKMKEPLNGLTLSDLFKNGLVSQTASEKALQQKQQQALHQQQQVQLLLQQQAQQLLQQQAAQQQQQLQQQQKKFKQQQQIADAKKVDETKVLQELKRKMEQAAMLEIKKKCLQPSASVVPASTTVASTIISPPLLPVQTLASPAATTGIGTQDWTSLDLMVLTERMKRAIPGPDHMQFGKMEGRLDWSQIAFAKYSPADCRTKWSEVCL